MAALRARTLFLVALTLALLAAKAHRMDRPWTVGVDQMGARYSNIARNFVRDGFSDLIQRTRLGDPPPGTDYPPYHLHPPLAPLAAGVVFAITGTDRAWAARLSVLPVALGCLLLLYLLARRSGGPRRAAAALLFAVMAPATCFYGLFPDPLGWWIIFFQLLFVALMEPWLRPRSREPGWGRGLALAVVFVVGMMAEWQMVLLLPLFGVAWLASRRRGRLGAVLPLAAAVPIAALLYRMVLPAPEGEGYRFVLLKLAKFSQWSSEFWLHVARDHVGLFGWPLLGLALLGLGGLLVRTARRRATSLDRVIWTLLAFHAIACSIYPTSARYHDYYHLYSLAGVALLAGNAFLRLHDTLRVRLGRRSGALAAGAALLAIGVFSVHQALERDRKYDDSVSRIVLESHVMREAVQRDEIVASTLGLDANESIGYYADRMIFPLVGTPLMLRSLLESPFKPSAFVIPRHEMSSYPELAAFLDAGWPRRDLPFHFAYDLRTARRTVGPGAPARPHDFTSPDDGLAAPRDASCRVIGNRIEIHWELLRDARVVGYRVFFGSAPGLYLNHVDAEAPPLVHEMPTPGVLHVVVAPRLADGRVGTRSRNLRVEVHGGASPTTHALAVGLACAVLTCLYAAALWVGRGPRAE